MFHVIDENRDTTVRVELDRLTSDYNGNTPSPLVCGKKGGEVREAIPYKSFKSYSSQGKLRVRNMCKGCALRLGVYKGENKDVDGTGN